MEHMLDETVPTEDLKKFEQKYHEELQTGKVGSRKKRVGYMYKISTCIVLHDYINTEDPSVVTLLVVQSPRRR